jgi:hypothetical protein
MEENMKKIIALLLLTIPLSGCLAVLLPISLGLQTAAFTMGFENLPKYCVTTGNNVGDRVSLPGGKMGTIEKLHGPYSNCTNIRPIGATITENK